MDARRFEFEDESFDFVFSASTIEHLGSREGSKVTLIEMHRVLKPGGALVLTTEIKLNRLGRDITHTKIFAVEPLLELYEKCGSELKDKEVDMQVENHYLKK